MESLPTFTKVARQRWESIPAHVRQRLLSYVWRGHCSHEVTITDLSGTVKERNLLLVGRGFLWMRTPTQVDRGFRRMVTGESGDGELLAVEGCRSDERLRNSGSQ